ncbi:MAG: A24 family peptidase [Planctomycetota bacterium]
MSVIRVEMWAYGVLAAVLVVAAAVDVRRGKIPNAITYPAVAVALIGHMLLGGWTGDETRLGLAQSLIGLAVGFGPLLVVWRLGGIGGGDAKLMAAVGALGGVNFAMSALFYGLAVAALMAIGVMIHKRILRKTMGRIFRFVYLALVRSRPGSPAAADSPVIPFGLALCIGSAAALVELLLRGKVVLEI